MARRRPSGDGMVRKRDDGRIILAQRLDRWLGRYAGRPTPVGKLSGKYRMYAEQ